MPRIESALAASGRDRSGFEISGGGFVATGATDEAVARAFEWVRMRVGFYGSTRAYWPVFEVHGLEELGEKLNHLSKAGEWDEMTRAVSDDVVRLFAAVGRHDELKDAMAERFGGLVDTVSAGTPVDEPGGLPPELIREIQSIPTPFSGFGSGR